MILYNEVCTGCASPFHFTPINIGIADEMMWLLQAIPLSLTNEMGRDLGEVGV